MIDGADYHTYPDVSILVVLDWTMMRGVRERRGQLLAVSILVVLDWTMMLGYAMRTLQD